MKICVAVIALMAFAGACAQQGSKLIAKNPAVATANAAEHVQAGHQAFGAQDFERAADEYAAALAAGADTPLIHFRYGYALHVTGRPREALPHHIKATNIEVPALRIDALYNAACACALLNRKAESLDWLSKAIDAGFKDLEQVKTDHDLDSLRNDPEFQRLLDSIPAAR